MRSHALCNSKTRKPARTQDDHKANLPGDLQGAHKRRIRAAIKSFYERPGRRNHEH